MRQSLQLATTFLIASLSIAGICAFAAFSYNAVAAYELSKMFWLGTLIFGLGGTILSVLLFILPLIDDHQKASSNSDNQSRSEQ